MNGCPDPDREPGFYWVLPVLDPDGWMGVDVYPNSVQPAYWNGTEWDMLGTEEWAVRWVGDRIPDYVDPASLPREHWSIEQVKRLVVQAIVHHSQGVGMAVSSRVAADQIIDLLLPNAKHAHMPIPCTCPSDMHSDAFAPGGPLSGQRPPICLQHPRKK